MFQRVKIRSFEVGLLFREDEFQKLLGVGVHWIFNPFGKLRVDVVSQRDPWLEHPYLDQIVKSGTLEGRAGVLDLKDSQRALVWVDDRFNRVLQAGLYVYWTGQRKVRVELRDALAARFEHPDLKVISHTSGAADFLHFATVPMNYAGVLFIDGRYIETLSPGEYAFWNGGANALVVPVDLREALLDVGGQDIMTLDKVTLRLNALVMFRVIDPRKAVCQSEDARQTLYRETQLVLRASVGTRELDVLLTEKEGITKEIQESLRGRAAQLGLEITSLGIRDIILPGEMKELMNKVTEARKAAEANLLSRREETAAIRSQANTAKLLAESPTLMRLRELEVLEKIALAGKLNVILGDKSQGASGLAEKVINLL